jgi:hypothetical protein
MTVNRDLADLAQSLQSGIDIADGGTGATSAAAARTALGTAGDGANTDITSLQEVVTAAASGIIETNANFIDMCLVGPSVDGMAWKGAFSNGAVWTSLMLATVETAGSDAQVNIFDLTAGVLAGATPLATLTLSGATPTSIAASMGYVIVGTSDQGMHIVAPFDTGAWAEKTEGWPRSLTTSGAPVLTNVDVQLVSAGLKQAPIYDPSTNGPIPCFGISYGTGADTQSLIKDDGNVYDRSGTVASAGLPCFISNGYFFSVVASDRVYRSVSPIDAITADDWSYNDAVQTGSAGAPGTGMDAALDINNGWIVGADADHLIVALEPGTSADLSSATQRSPSAEINRTYNTGFMPAQIVLAALANSDTADRSNNSNTLTENGTVTEGAVASGAELKGYSGFSASNFLSKSGQDTDFEVGASGSISILVWFKSSEIGSDGFIYSYGQTGVSTNRMIVYLNSSGDTISCTLQDGSVAISTHQLSGVADDGGWHLAAFVLDRTAGQLIGYGDGVPAGSAGDASSLGAIANANANLTIGTANTSGGAPASTATVCLVRVSKSVLSADQVRKIYDAEAPMFAANAKVLLQSGSTDAVLDAKIDPLSGKYIVTQTDSQEIFDGLAIETERTVATGGSTFEHGLLWGDAVAEINNANLFASTPATDQRQVNEMVRSLSADMPGGIDLSKAKAWIYFENGASISASYNIEALNNHGTGNMSVDFAVPFKSAKYVAVSMSANRAGSSGGVIICTTSDTKGQTAANFGFGWSFFNDTYANEDGWLAFFGELENE